MAELLERLSQALAARYRIERELGHGGMAVVFLARDLRHERPVAVKVLRPELAAVLGPGRFLREIQLAASLTHPNILPLLDSGEADGLLYYTMPFVEGETLRRRLERDRQLPVEESVRIAREVADALDYAHRQGVVHRDVKPENILFAAGHAMVADFGIAHALEAAGGDKLTTTGVILGTPAYLSPEQAGGGRGVDARADQYGLGCVLYEMLAGQPPFTGPSAESLLHQHLNVPARAVTELRPAVPPALATAVTRALAKNPADRFESTARFADSLAPPALAGASPVPAAARARPARSVVPWAAVAAALVAAVVVALWAWLRPPGGTPELELTRITYDTGMDFDPAISRDGKLLAYASDRGGDGDLDLWVQYVAERTPRRLTHDAPSDRVPSFSPDGTRLVFRSERDSGGIYEVSTLGGPLRKLADGGTVPRFSPDGSWISFIEEPPGRWIAARRMFLLPAEGGPPRPLAHGFVTSAPPTNGGPIWSPDGRHVMFRGGRAGRNDPWDWWVAPVDGGPPVATGAVRSVGRQDVIQFPCVWLPRHVIFAAGTTIEGVNLYRARIDPRTFRIGGPVEPLTSGPGVKYTFAMAGDGTLVVPDLTWTVQIWEAAIDPVSGLARQGPERVTSDAAPKYGLAAARGGSRLAYSTFSGSRQRHGVELRVRDLASGEETTPVTTAGSVKRTDLIAVLDDRGTTLAWQDDVAGRATAFLQRPGESAGRELCRECAVTGFLPGSGDAVIAYGPQRLVRHDPATGAERDLVRLAAGSIVDSDPAPGGRRIAVLWGKRDRSVGICVAPLRDSAVSERDFVPLVEEPAYCACPRWSADGRRLYFLSGRDGFGCVWMQRVDAATGRPAGGPVAVVHNHRADRSLFGPRDAWSIAVTRDRLYFNAAEMHGNFWKAKLDPR